MIRRRLLGLTTGANINTLFNFCNCWFELTVCITVILALFHFSSFGNLLYWSRFVTLPIHVLISETILTSVLSWFLLSLLSPVLFCILFGFSSLFSAHIKNEIIHHDVEHAPVDCFLCRIFLTIQFVSPAVVYIFVIQTLNSLISSIFLQIQFSKAFHYFSKSCSQYPGLRCV